MNERDKELNEVLEELAKNLDITDTEDAAIRLSYQAVGEYLAQEGSSLSEWKSFPKDHSILVQLFAQLLKVMIWILI